MEIRKNKNLLTKFNKIIIIFCDNKGQLGNNINGGNGFEK